MNYRDEVSVVRRLTAQIEQGETKTDTLKWQRAEHLAAMCASKSQPQVAKDVALSESTVWTSVEAWKRYGDFSREKRPSYAKVNYEVTGRGPGFGSSANTIPEKLSYTEKVDLVRKLVADPVVRAAVEPEMSAPLPRVTHRSESSLTSEWESWLTRLNSLLMDGAKLANREDEDLSGYAALARTFYDRITERQLDAEIRAFFEEVQA